MTKVQTALYSAHLDDINLNWEVHKNPYYPERILCTHHKKPPREKLYGPLYLLQNPIPSDGPHNLKKENA